MNAELEKRARDLINELDAFITRDGEWDTQKAAEDVITAALIAWGNERLEEAAKKVDHILKEGGGTYGDAIRELKEE